jgi:predicted enzyme related to lactoylglutathione lyase
MAYLFSIAIRVANVESMVAFYSEAFQIQFQEVKTYGIPSQFGELNGTTLKLVPIRDETDFQGFSIHQPGFLVEDVQRVIDIAIKHGGRQEGRTLQVDGKIQAAIRDPDGNTLELYSKE